MRQVPFTNYMENILRPLTCNNDSDCGSTLICFLLKCEGELEFGDQLILLSYTTEFLSSFSSTEAESGTTRTCGEPDLHSSRGLNCGGGKCRGRTGEGGRGSTPNSGRFYPYPLLFWPQVISSFLAPSYFEFEAERPLFKSHMPSGALTVDDKISLFCFVSFCSTARIISGASKHIFSLH